MYFTPARKGGRARETSAMGPKGHHMPATKGSWLPRATGSQGQRAPKGNWLPRAAGYQGQLATKGHHAGYQGTPCWLPRATGRLDGSTWTSAPAHRSSSPSPAAIPSPPPALSPSRLPTPMSSGQPPNPSTTPNPHIHLSQGQPHKHQLAHPPLLCLPSAPIHTPTMCTRTHCTRTCQVDSHANMP